MNEPKSLTTLETADRMLAEVASVDDAKQLINMAEMARVYARQSKLGTSAINHATIVKLRAERRLADMVDAGQERGEIAGASSFRGNQSVSPDSGLSTLDSIGVEKQRLAEARIIRDAYSDDDLMALKARADAEDEILSRQKLIREARDENARNAVVQRERVERFFPLFTAIETLAKASEDAETWAADVPEWNRYRVSDNLDQAYYWLSALKEAWDGQ